MSGTASLPRSLKSLCALFLLSVPLLGQTGLGVVQGTVQDSSKAVIPNAKVVLTNTATGVGREGVTNSAGIYYFGSVPIGPYTLAIEAAGFKRWEGTLAVQAGQTVEINPPMEVGSVQSTVEVTGAAPVIETTGGQVSDVKDAMRIHDLPLNGRQISNLFDLTPGVVGGAAPRTNGMKVGSTDMNLDGISYIDRFGGGIARVQPGLDTVQEFRIETSGSSAQFSRPATVELVTRSGTNELHGAGFEVLRNNADGLRARQRQDGNTSAKLIRNEYGGYLGGPVLIPKIYNGKNKTFWMVDWEGLKQRQNSFAITSVPTPAMFGGDLSSITDTSGNKYTMYDPLTTGANGSRQPFAGNVIPASRISQYAKIFQSVTPVPNIGGNLNPWLESNFSNAYPNDQDQHTWTIKVDQNFSEKDTLSGRITVSPTLNALQGGRFGFPPPGCTDCGGSGVTDSHVYSSHVRWDHVFSPIFLNQLQLAGFRSATHNGTLADSTNWASKLGLPNPFGVKGWPSIYAQDFSGSDPFANFLYYGGWDGDNNKHQNLTSYEVDDNVTWIKGRHTVKFGFKGRTEQNNVEELQQAEGSHSFYSSWTGLYDPSSLGQAPFTGAGFASLLLGLPATLGDQYNRGYFYFQQKEIGAYVDDSWKVSPRLTIGVGVRWDHWTPYHEAQNRLVNLDPNNYPGFTLISPGNTSINSLPNIPSGVLGSWAARGLSWVTADSVPGFPKALIPQYWKDFSPRLSAAYRIDNKWVVRAGYGMYYWPMPLSQILQSSRTNPPLNLFFSNLVSTQDGKNPNYALLNAPGPNDSLPNATVNVQGIVPLPSTSQGIYVFDPHHWADDRMQEWNLTIERELMKDTSLRLSYIGNHGSNLEQQTAFNSALAGLNYQMQTGLQAQPGQAGADLRRPNPNWNGTVMSHIGYSNSTSFQAQVERRFSSGLSFQWSYTYDHIMTTSDAGGSSAGGDGAYLPQNSYILGDPNLTVSQRLKLIYANSSSVPPQYIKWNGIYELPFGRGKHFASHVSRPVNEIVGGWQVAFIGSWEGGAWMGVNTSNGTNTGSSVSNTEWLFGNPALDPSKRLLLTIFGKNQKLWFAGDFNPSSATNVNLSLLENLVPVDRSQRRLRPLGSNFGNLIPFTLANGTVVLTRVTDLFSWNPQNFMLSPGAWNEDLSVFKYFDIIERVRVRFTADFFNVFNHPIDYLPGSTQDLNRTTGLLDLSRQVNDPRIIQFSVRLEF